MPKYIVNEESFARYIGGKLLQPGEGREFDDATVPPEHKGDEAPTAEVVPDADAQLREDLKQSVRVLLATLQDVAPEVLDRMAALESATETPRKSLLTGIDVEKLRRASVAVEQEQAAAREREEFAVLQSHADRLYQKQLAELTEEERTAVQEAAKTPQV